MTRVYLVVDSHCPSMAYTAVDSIWQTEKLARIKARKLNIWWMKVSTGGTSPIDYSPRYTVQCREVGK